ncbi:MAG: hypothetical protein M3Y33_03920 [Actinomycetota bacterium]|nr:hypothetical protein [Actinomycetota bacterium]
MSGHDESLRERSWDRVLEPLFSSDKPDRHVVLDDALNPAALAGLRSDLLSSWDWHYRAQPGYVLCLAPPQSPVIRDVTGRLVEILGQFRPGLEVCEEWAFLHQRPFEEFVHSDIGTYVWTLWLTPEQWDRSPDTSGLSLFPLSRPEDMPNSRKHTVAYFEENSVSTRTYVPYRENRAVMFPASTFHAIGPCDFDASVTERMRCSVSIFLDAQDHWAAQRQPNGLTPEPPTHEF